MIGTSIENANEQTKREAVENACKMANAHSFIVELPDGYNTRVGEGGFLLSGGQKQRLAIARAIVKDPPILILDEATSALDSESEKLIQQSIEQVANDTTILIVAHRLSTIAKADQVYVMRAGDVIEEGSYHDLSKKAGGELHAMLLIQSPTGNTLPVA